MNGPQRLRKALLKRILESQRNACYVLITCGQPTEDGEMQVELTYEGDAGLASYLVESAQSFLDDAIERDLVAAEPLDELSASASRHS